MFGHFAYLLEGVKNLDTLCPYRMKITADGEVFDGEYLFGAISNSTSIAGLMKLSPDEVSFDDGKFELLLVPCRERGAMQALIFSAHTRTISTRGAHLPPRQALSRRRRRGHSGRSTASTTPARRSWRSGSKIMGSRCYYKIFAERVIDGRGD